MSLAANQHISEGMKTLQICVDTYEDKQMTGIVYHTSMPNGARFTNLMQLLLCVEHILDSMDFPKASTEKRRFTKGLEPLTLLDESNQSRRSGINATFFVRIMFRQNASWQGTVVWKEGSSEMMFRSALELVMLMDSALEGE